MNPSKGPHTPGPWYVQPSQLSQGKQEVIVGPDSVTIIALMECGRRCDKFNARLIAAAPVMFDALEAVQRLIKEALPKFNWGASALDANAIMLLNEVPGQIRAAIAKVKGKA
jgi:hypothetical protein